MNNFDIIVIGAGHAGIEAAMAASRMGLNTLMLTFDADSVGRMSCNPAIGGVGKGQLVKEIDALGGVMATAADACAIQYRMLNSSKGPAVQSSRAQIDRFAYNRYMQKLISGQKGLELRQSRAAGLLLSDGRICGIICEDKTQINSKAVVVCAGTFLDGLMHVGLKSSPGGRMGEEASQSLPVSLAQAGFKLMRFKTGTCARLDKESIDYSRLTVQHGDEHIVPFSFSTAKTVLEQVPCHITYTSPLTHQLIRDNLSFSPLYSGLIKATGVRYCPSIEDKIVKFPDKSRHQIFLEPEGLESNMVYLNGLSTSLPQEVQLKMIHSIEGLEEAKVICFGYGIEHTVIDSTQLFPTLESKPVKGLFFAGQINGTTGYEEAAAQGLVAGINASLYCLEKTAFVLDRSSSYTGVLIDDLTTKGTMEPYRMFTSRVEYRLLLREDNADIRLRKAGHDFGLVEEKPFRRTMEKIEMAKSGLCLIKKLRLKPDEPGSRLLEKETGIKLKRMAHAENLLKRPQISFALLRSIFPVLNAIQESAARQIEIEVKYSGFIDRQKSEVAKFRNLEKILLPQSIDYKSIPGLSREIKEKLNKFRPLNLGQAQRISGITPAAISLLMVFLRKGQKDQS